MPNVDGAGVVVAVLGGTEDVRLLAPGRDRPGARRLDVRFRPRLRTSVSVAGETTSAAAVQVGAFAGAPGAASIPRMSRGTHGPPGDEECRRAR